MAADAAASAAAAAAAAATSASLVRRGRGAHDGERVGARGRSLGPNRHTNPARTPTRRAGRPPRRRSCVFSVSERASLVGARRRAVALPPLPRPSRRRCSRRPWASRRHSPPRIAKIAPAPLTRAGGAGAAGGVASGSRGRRATGSPTRSAVRGCGARLWHRRRRRRGGLGASRVLLTDGGSRASALAERNTSSTATTLRPTLRRRRKLLWGDEEALPRALRRAISSDGGTAFRWRTRCAAPARRRPPRVVLCDQPRFRGAKTLVFHDLASGMD